MPQDYGKSLTQAQLSDLVQFLIDSTPATP